MRIGDSIGFSVRLCTFFAEQDRLFTGYLRAEGQLVYSELTLLCAMHEAVQPLALEPLAELLMLSPRTVRSMLLDLEDKGFVSKLNDPEDRRFMLVRLTEHGRTVTERANRDIYLLMKESLWEALPESDFEDVLKKGMRHDVNHIRGFAVEPFGDLPHTDLPISVDHFIFWRIIVDRWTRTLRDESDLSLNDFCVLYYLSECEKLISSEIADALLLPRSALSLCKSHLLESTLVSEQEEEGDGRKVVLSCTPQGKHLAKQMFEKLDALTRDIHSGMAEEDSGVVSAWYARMFSNMRKHRRKQSKAVK